MNSDLINIIIEEIKGEFSLVEWENNNISFIHNETKLLFQLIIKGSYLMGLSKEEEVVAMKLSDPLPFNPEELRPVHEVKIDSFLISQTPLTNHQVSKFIPSWDYEEGNKDTPANVSFDIIEKIQNLTNMRIPNEEEWEYACRGGTNTLFVFGNEIPNDEVLCKWLDCDFSDLTILSPNPFGLYGLFAGEWCGNNYQENYYPLTKLSKWKVLRGGGALFYPWQDDEWIWCMSSMRMSAENIGEDGCAAFRLIKVLSGMNV